MAAPFFMGLRKKRNIFYAPPAGPAVGKGLDAADTASGFTGNPAMGSVF
ncbi:MAG: hypothetical protein Q8P24_19900 [Desulfobacterales bacterium]|nr:hypothetical protein [Desulfobacterales bacterium]